jgi:hypothetical protein
MCAERAQFVRSRPRRCGGVINPHKIGVGVRECMCSARPAYIERDDVLRQDPTVHIARPNGVARRAAQVIDRRGEVGACRRRELPAPETTAGAASVSRTDPPGLRSPSCVGLTAIVGFRDFAATVGGCVF